MSVTTALTTVDVLCAVILTAVAVWDFVSDDDGDDGSGGSGFGVIVHSSCSRLSRLSSSSLIIEITV
jgi:hypothetical protein